MTSDSNASPDPTGGTSVLGDAQPFAGESPTTTEPVAVRTDAFSRLKSDAIGFRDQAADQARAFASTGKDRATEILDEYAGTVQEAAVEIERLAGPQVAQYAHKAADFLEEVAEGLRTKEVDELIDEARELIRRSPALAIGAAAALGFALSRFLKATSDRLEPASFPVSRRSGAQTYDA